MCLQMCSCLSDEFQLQMSKSFHCVVTTPSSYVLLGFVQFSVRLLHSGFPPCQKKQICLPLGLISFLFSCLFYLFIYSLKRQKRQANRRVCHTLWRVTEETRHLYLWVRQCKCDCTLFLWCTLWLASLDSNLIWSPKWPQLPKDLRALFCSKRQCHSNVMFAWLQRLPQRPAYSWQGLAGTEFEVTIRSL